MDRIIRAGRVEKSGLKPSDLKKNIWVFPKIGVLQNGWFIMETLLKFMIWGYPYFWKPPIYTRCMSFMSYVCFNCILVEGATAITIEFAREARAVHRQSFLGFGRLCTKPEKNYHRFNSHGHMRHATCPSVACADEKRFGMKRLISSHKCFEYGMLSLKKRNEHNLCTI